MPDVEDLYPPGLRYPLVDEIWAAVQAIQEALEDDTTGLEALKNLLENIPTTSEFDEALNVIKTRSGGSYDRHIDSLEAAGEESHHLTKIFPEDTDETVTFTAGGVANTFGAWAEIVDNVPNTFSSKITSPTHITAFMIEDASKKDVAYLLEVAYGEAKTVVSRYRFISGETKLPPIQQMRVRSDDIPVGETVYYRMKCESAGETCTLHLRYYYHGGS